MTTDPTHIVRGRELRPLLPSPLEVLDDDRLTRRGVTLSLKRDDLIHPDIPGNKWRKPKYNLAEASAGGHHTLLTFGGAYSNHIRAVAATPTDPHRRPNRPTGDQACPDGLNARMSHGAIYLTHQGRQSQVVES